jgi:hypothetical protein
VAAGGSGVRGPLEGLGGGGMTHRPAGRSVPSQGSVSRRRPPMPPWLHRSLGITRHSSVRRPPHHPDRPIRRGEGDDRGRVDTHKQRHYGLALDPLGQMPRRARLCGERIMSAAVAGTTSFRPSALTPRYGTRPPFDLVGAHMPPECSSGRHHPGWLFSVSWSSRGRSVSPIP